MTYRIMQQSQKTYTHLETYRNFTDPQRDTFCELQGTTVPDAKVLPASQQKEDIYTSVLTFSG